MPKGVYVRKPGGNNNNLQHGQSYTATYRTWRSMLTRCTNPRHHNYRLWGGRGIKVCDAWKDFKTFYADMGDRPVGMTLDRIDNEGDYDPTNCRWASQKEQQRNRRDNVFLTLEGRTATLTEWANRIGISKVTLCARLTRYGWSVERALTTPAQVKSQAFRSK